MPPDAAANALRHVCFISLPFADTPPTMMMLISDALLAAFDDVADFLMFHLMMLSPPIRCFSRVFQFACLRVVVFCRRLSHARLALLRRLLFFLQYHNACVLPRSH